MTTASPKKQSIFDRLNDPSSFHGTHKHRFDGDGHGRGLEGRDSVAKGNGYVAGGRSTNGVSDLSQITRTNLNTHGSRMENMKPSRSPSPTRAPSKQGNYSASGSQSERDSGAKKQSIFDKLSNPSTFHGTHKERFDADGKGKGRVGRDQQTGTRDLSQLVRPGL
jgi:hypothetical protein